MMLEFSSPNIGCFVSRLAETFARPTVPVGFRFVTVLARFRFAIVFLISAGLLSRLDSVQIAREKSRQVCKVSQATVLHKGFDASYSWQGKCSEGSVRLVQRSLG